MPIQLPTQPLPPTDSNPKTLVIYGPPKIGKTSIVAALDDCLIIDLENGSNFVTALKVKLDNILQVNGLEEAVKAAKFPYKYVCVDTLDKLEEWCEVEATARYKASPQGKGFGGKSVLELPQGGGYFHLRNVFYEYFNRLRNLAPNAIFIGHIRDKMLTADGKDVTSKDLDLTGKIRNIVCAYTDAIGHAYRDKDGKLMISFITTDSANCGSRCPHLINKAFSFTSPATTNDWKQIYL
jgi:hypothetical protein